MLTTISHSSGLECRLATPPSMNPTSQICQRLILHLPKCKMRNAELKARWRLPRVLTLLLCVADRKATSLPSKRL